MKPVLVNSVPKSGTTWLRTLVSSLPGYTNHRLEGRKASDPDGLLRVKPGAVFHGHLMHSERVREIAQARGFAVFFIYRDVRDVIVSDYHHQRYLNPKRAPEWLGTMSFDQAVRGDVLGRWSSAVRRFMDVPNWIADPLASTVRYEDLRADTLGEFTRLLREQELEVARDDVRAAVERSSFEAVSARRPGEEDRRSPFRKGLVGDWRNHFSAEAHAHLMKQVEGPLIALGYDPHYPHDE